MPYSKLKQLRLQHSWTQKQVAEKLFISQNAYSKLEAGETRLKLDHIEALAKIYKKDPEYFLTKGNKEAIPANYTANRTDAADVRNLYYCPQDMIDKLLAAKDEVIRSKDEAIEALKITVFQLQARLPQGDRQKQTETLNV